MDILDNARIIKHLTDKESVWELWQILCGINRELDDARHKIKCIRDGKDCDECELWEVWCSISTDGLLSIPDTSIMKQQVESLNLGKLHTWLIDESTSKEDLQFRLNKIKGIVGSMWSRNDYVQVWCMLNGFKPTPDFEVGKEWEIKNGIIPTQSLSKQIYEVATQLDKTHSEYEIDKRVMRLNKVLLDWFKVVGFILGETYSMIEEAEQILNPQPTQMETEQTESPRNHNKLLDDMEIKSVFDEIIAMGLMTYRDGFYWWETENVLLSYLCSQISRYKELSKQMRGDDYLPNWKCFIGIFKVKGEQGNWIDCDNNKLGEYKKQYKKNHGGDFNPDGCKEIDKVVSKYLI